jgi:hypothetical protein
MTPLHPVNGEQEHHHLPKDLKELGNLAHLLFEWPIRQAPRLALPGFILVAGIIQAATIGLFSISYKTPSESQPDSPQIYFIPPDSATARKLAPWLAANDPAIFSPQYDTRDAIPSPPPLKYRPSYEEPPPPLRPLPVETLLPLEPPALPEMANLLQKKTGRVIATASQPSQPLPPTLVRWKDDLAARPLQTTTVPPTPAGNAALQPALYEVGVSPEGLPMHCVLLDSSGDPESDEAGSVWIHAQRFQPADKDSWGRVLLLWGSPAHADQKTSNP